MLKFNCQNVKSESPMMVKRFAIGGDGASTKLRINLEASPVGMVFIGNKKPSYAFMRQSSTEVYLTTAEGFLNIEFSRAPADGERVDIDIEFFYEGD